MPKAKAKTKAKSKTKTKKKVTKARAKVKARNAFYAQSGGVTAVIKRLRLRRDRDCTQAQKQDGKVYAGRNGIIGALTEDLIDTSKESAPRIAPCATRRPAPSAPVATSSRAWSRTAANTSA